MTFSQVHNDDNGSVVVLAPPCLWRRQRCFAAATLIAIALNGLRPAVNFARMGGEGADWLCMRFAPRQIRYAQTTAVLAPPRPWRQGGALCSGFTHYHLSQCVKACCEWRENRWRKARFGLVIQQSTGRESTNNLPSWLAIGQGGQRRRRRRS